MNIFLDYRFNKMTGCGRYTDSLLNCLRNDQKDFYFYLYPDIRFNGYGGRKIDLFSSMAYELLFFHIELQNKCDLFHCTKNFGVPLLGSIPVVTTIHDVIPLALRGDYSKSFFRNAYFNLNYLSAVYRSQAIITISKYSLNSVCKMYPKFKKKIICIPQGCNSKLSDTVSDENARTILSLLGIKRPFILAMGGAEPRKNIQMLVDLYDSHKESIPFDLVVIGGQWGNLFVQVPKERICEFHLLKKLSEQELVSLYKLAVCFVFPSIYEGFGLPVLEAMACGTPVLAHNGTSIPEVAGDAAMLVDMHNPEECLIGLRKMLSDRPLREHYILAGQERVRLFSWEDTAARTLEVYKSVLQQ
ncbi:MAG: glycosyltransferase family 1 protein [Negativicutes bacterium]|nr:glycosyltransferase family 1 protein [Negativicutes bacterium]